MKAAINMNTPMFLTDFFFMKLPISYEWTNFYEHAHFHICYIDPSHLRRIEKAFTTFIAWEDFFDKKF